MSNTQSLRERFEHSLRRIREIVNADTVNLDEMLVESVYSQESREVFEQDFPSQTESEQEHLRKALQDTDPDRTGSHLTERQLDETVRAGLIAYAATRDPYQYRSSAAASGSYANADTQSIQTGSGGLIETAPEGSYSPESFDTRAIGEHNENTILYNTLACRQTGFAEAFFPTKVIAPSQSGVEIALSYQKIIDYKSAPSKHPNDGSPLGHTSHRLVQGVREPELLNTATTELIPHYREDVNEDHFVSDDYAKTYERSVGDRRYPTRPLAIDRSHNLLGLSQRADQIDSEQFDQTDQIAPGARLASIYVGFDYDDEHIATVHNVEYASYNEFKPGHEDYVRGVTLNFRSDSLLIDKNTKFVGQPYQPIQEKIIYSDKTVIFSVRVYGDLDLDTGALSVHAGEVRFEKVLNKHGQPLKESDDEYQEIVSTLEDMNPRVVGYEIRARRSNTNWRSIGTLVDTSTPRESYAISPGYPVSAWVGSGEDLRSDKLAAMINTARIRSSNSAVTALLNYRDQLAHYQTALEKGHPVDIIGAGRHLIHPYYTHQRFNVQDEIFVLSNHELFTAAQRVIVEAVRTVAYRLYKESEYASVLELFADANEKPMVLIGCDPYIQRYLHIDGQIGGLLGEHLDYQVVSTRDERMTNRVFITFTRQRPGSEDGLSFGVHGYMPEFIDRVEREHDGAHFQCYQVTPRNVHIPVLPILGEIEVEGIDDLSRVDVPDLDDDVLESIFSEIQDAESRAKKYTDDQIEQTVDGTVSDMVSSAEKRANTYTDDQLSDFKSGKYSDDLTNLERDLESYTDKQVSQAESDARSYTRNRIEDHAEKTSGVHGVEEGDTLESSSSAQAKADEALSEAKSYTDSQLDSTTKNSKEYTDDQIKDHASETGDIHGVPEGESVEWHSSAQKKADKAETNAKDHADSELTAHIDAEDPHDQYQLLSEKGKADGYAPLDEDGLIDGKYLPFDANLDGRYLRVEENLSDLGSLQDARDNLSVYSRETIDDLLADTNLWYRGYRQSVTDLRGEGNGDLTLEREGSEEPDLVVDLSHTHDFADLPISASDADSWDKAHEKTIESLTLDASNQTIELTLTRNDQSTLSDSVTLNSSDWDKAYSRSPVSISGDGNGTLELTREDGSVLTTDLDHRHDSRYVRLSQRGEASGVAPLNSDGIIDNQYLPSFDITKTTVVADIDERDDLSASEGDVAIVEDASDDSQIESGSQSYIYDGDSWVPLQSPDDVVYSVNGKRGHVTLNYEDVGADSKGSADKAETNAVNRSERYADNAVSNHSAKTSGVHGLSSDESVESETGAQSKADSALSKAKTYTDQQTSSALNDHTDASDPHDQYQLRDERGEASGYAPLDEDALVPKSHLPTISRDVRIESVDDIDERDELTGLDTGDMAIVDDASDDPDVTQGAATYAWDGEGWRLLANDTSRVLSVNDKTGDVVLDHEDVGAEPSGRADELISEHLDASDPHSQYLLADQVGAADGVAPLNDEGLISGEYLPEFSSIDTYTFDNIAERDNHTAKRGHFAIVLDASADPEVDSGSATYIYNGDEWRRLPKSDDAVFSVNEKKGHVVLDHTDVGAAPADAGDKALSDAKEYTDDQIEDHASKTDNVHGIGVDEEFETVSGAQSKADEAEQAARTDAKTYVDDELLAHLQESDPHDQYVLRSERNEADGFVGLNSDGLIDQDYLPALKITDVFVFDDIEERDDHSAKEGEVAIVMDASGDSDVSEGSATYIWDGSQWQRLRQPDDVVYSVNGRQGDITLDAEAVNADPAGAADDAESSANTYTDDQLKSHADKDSGIHGLASGETFESTSGAQKKADKARDTATKYTDTELENHLDAEDPHTQYQLRSERGQPNGYAALNSDGKIKSDQLPKITTSDVYVFKDLAERNDSETTFGVGDIAIVKDASDDSNIESGGANYIHDGDEWQLLEHPDDAVLSVNDKTGHVTLDAEDVDADPSGSSESALSDAKAYTDEELEAHSTQDGGTHGLSSDEVFESTDGAQSKADKAESDANSYTDTELSNHAQRDNDVHGLSEGEYFESTSGAQEKVDEHAEKRGDTHGVPAGERIEWRSSAQSKADEALSKAKSYTDDELSDHESATGDTHGVPEGETIEWQSSAQTKADKAETNAVNQAEQYTDGAVSDHGDKSGGTHGLSEDEVFESESGAQSKADSAEQSANSYTDEHASLEGGTHNVPDGERIEWKSAAQEKADDAESSAKDYADLKLEDHASKSGDTHGVPDGETIEWKSAAQNKADKAESNAKDYTDSQLSDHADLKGDTHGLGEDETFESTDGAQSKANAAEVSAKSYTDNHADRSEGVHGLGPDEAVESVSGAQSKADEALSEAKSYADTLVDESIDGEIGTYLEQGYVSAPVLENPPTIEDSDRISAHLYLEGSAYRSLYSADEHAHRRFQVVELGDGEVDPPSTIDWDSPDQDFTTEKESTFLDLSLDKTYAIRAMDELENGVESNWSEVLIVTTAEGEVLAPTLIAPEDEETSVTETPVLETEPLKLSDTIDESDPEDGHDDSYWVIERTDTDEVLAEFYSSDETDYDNLRVKLPPRILVEGQVEHRWYVRHYHRKYGWSEPSPASTFTTDESFTKLYIVSDEDYAHILDVETMETEMSTVRLDSDPEAVAYHKDGEVYVVSRDSIFYRLDPYTLSVIERNQFSALNEPRDIILRDDRVGFVLNRYGQRIYRVNLDGLSAVGDRELGPDSNWHMTKPYKDGVFVYCSDNRYVYYLDGQNLEIEHEAENNGETVGYSADHDGEHLYVLNGNDEIQVYRADDLSTVQTSSVREGLDSTGCYIVAPENHDYVYVTNDADQLLKIRKSDLEEVDSCRDLENYDEAIQLIFDPNGYVYHITIAGYITNVDINDMSIVETYDHSNQFGHINEVAIRK